MIITKLDEKGISVVDQSESTIGQSRQVTEFNYKVLPRLNKEFFTIDMLVAIANTATADECKKVILEKVKECENYSNFNVCDVITTTNQEILITFEYCERGF